jgi:hypothetical protein
MKTGLYYSVTIHGSQARGVQLYSGSSLDKASAAESLARQIMVTTHGTGTVSANYHGTLTTYQFLNGQRIGQNAEAR